MIGNVIQSAFLRPADYPTAAALSFMLMAAILVLVFVYVRARRHGGAALSSASAALARPTTLGAGRSALLVLLYMFVPIGVVVALSFNQPRRARQLQLQRVHAGQLDATSASPTGMCDSLRLSLADRPRWPPLVRHRARHADGLRAGPAPVPRPVGGQPADLPADGDPRGRDGLLAAGAVRLRRLRRAGLLDDRRSRT